MEGTGAGRGTPGVGDPTLSGAVPAPPRTVPSRPALPAAAVVVAVAGPAPRSPPRAGGGRPGPGRGSPSTAPSWAGAQVRVAFRLPPLLPAAAPARSRRQAGSRPRSAPGAAAPPATAVAMLWLPQPALGTRAAETRAYSRRRSRQVSAPSGPGRAGPSRAKRGQAGPAGRGSPSLGLGGSEPGPSPSWSRGPALQPGGPCPPPEAAATSPDRRLAGPGRHPTPPPAVGRRPLPPLRPPLLCRPGTLLSSAQGGTCGRLRRQPAAPRPGTDNGATFSPWDGLSARPSPPPGELSPSRGRHFGERPSSAPLSPPLP